MKKQIKKLKQEVSNLTIQVDDLNEEMGDIYRDKRRKARITEGIVRYAAILSIVGIAVSLVYSTFFK